MKQILIDFARNLWAGGRLLALRPVDVRDFRSTPEQFVLLAFVGIAMQIAMDMAEHPWSGYLNWPSLPYYLLLPVLDLFMGLCLARLYRRRRLMAWWPIAGMVVSCWITLTLWPLVRWDNLQLHGVDQIIWSRAYVIMIGLTIWTMVVLLLALKRALNTSLRQAILVCVAMFPLQFVAAMLVNEPLWLAATQEDIADTAVANTPLVLDESFLYEEKDRLDRQLASLKPQRPGVVDTYFLAVAGDASQRVFKHEALAIRQLFDTRFDTAGRSVVLINSNITAGHRPLATRTSIETTLQQIGTVMDPTEDVLVLYLTSHGSPDHEFVLSYEPLSLLPITPNWLKETLQRAGIQWRVIVVSACYSGGFIPPLQNDTTLLVTAADATHPSFGCEDREQFTFFGQAMFDNALRQTRSWQQAFEQAKTSIREREQKEGFEPSNPQLSIGRAVLSKLSAASFNSGDVP
ncbi:C13 family peptidase [Chitinivorax sp. B]|uniref:C13 family peptidase n=1 Tax=Chitinivorax sp. B TaxID=2502235 RepID=UPI0010F5A2D7|nr:C13 family peptidase [Chitinivorax sp. B]